MSTRCVIAMIVSDDREVFRSYSDPHPSFSQAPNALLEGLANAKDFEIHTICCVQKPVNSPIRIFENIYHHTLLVPKLGWLRTGYSGCISAIRSKLRQISPDLVHGQGTERYCALAAVRSGFPNVVTIHGNMVELVKASPATFGIYGWLTARLENYTLPRALGVFCNSAYTERVVERRSKKTWLVPNAVRSLFFSPLPIRGARPAPVFVNVGTVIAYKNQIELLEMAARLHQNKQRFELQFIGPLALTGSDRTRFLSLIQAAEAQGYSKYLRAKNNTELLKCFDAASALIHAPSQESFGLVVAEGLARNLRFFGFRTGGVVDIASAVDGAELVETGDWQGLKGAIERWMGAGCPTPTSAAAAIRMRYHPDVIAARHLEIYREVLATANRPEVARRR